MSYRAAALSLGNGEVLVRALTTLAWVTVAQTVCLGLWLRLRAPGTITVVMHGWSFGFWVGLTGIIASACWYTAFALQNASYVMALGQVELIFTYLASRFIFHERMVWREAAGVMITAAGILLVVLFG